MVDFLYTGDYTLSDDAVDEANDSEISQTKGVDSLESDNSGDSENEDTLRSDKSGDLGEEEDTENTSGQEMCRHIAVNAIAKYFNIPALQKRSRDFIRPNLKDKWPRQAFPALVRQALDTSDDTELHDDLAQAAMQHMGDLLHSVPEFFKMENSGDFYGRLCKYSFESRVVAASEAASNEKSLKLGLLLEQRQRAYEKAKLDEIIARLETLKEVPRCRHCSFEFGGKIDNNGGGSQYLVRCKKCLCRHH